MTTDDYLKGLEGAHGGRIAYCALPGGGIAICEQGVFGYFPVDRLGHLSGLRASLEADRLNKERLKLSQVEASLIIASSMANERRR